MLVGVAQDAHPQDGPDPQPPLDLGHAPMGEDLTAVDDGHRGAQLLQLGEDVGRDDDRLAQVAQLPQQLPELDAGPRIEAGRRLVEERRLGVVHEPARQARALLHAARQART